MDPVDTAAPAPARPASASPSAGGMPHGGVGGRRVSVTDFPAGCGKSVTLRQELAAVEKVGPSAVETCGSPRMALIYHIAAGSDWEQARRDGLYQWSTRGVTLAQEGFIHASTAPQVAPVANAFYQGDAGLVVLVIDTDLVEPEIRYEQPPGSERDVPAYLRAAQRGRGRASAPARGGRVRPLLV